MAIKVKRLVILAGVSFFVTACDDGESNLRLENKSWNCEGSGCEASFVIENLHDSNAELSYSIKLLKSIDDDGNRVPESIVGEANGKLQLKPQERQIVSEYIEVSDEPNAMSAGYSTLK